MSYVRFIEHLGRKIVLLDFVGVQGADQWSRALDDARRFFSALPPDQSALTLTDVTGTRYDRATVDAIKGLTTHNRPFVRVGAVVNNSTMHRAVIAMVALFARRKFEIFESRERALDWLASQP